MEFNRERIVRELESFHNRILNGSLAERITEREIITIINAASLLIEDEKKIKELTEKLTHQEIAYNELYELTIEK